MFRTLLTATALAAAASFAQAAPAPTGSVNGSFVEYTGTGTLGNNGINTNGTLFWMHESAGSYQGQAIDSWLVFFDPRRLSTIQGTVSFATDILYAFDTQAELFATSSFGKAGVSYDYSNRFMGLELLNRVNTSFSGDTMSFKWLANDPGDYVRVFTSAVPEPETYAMMLAGLAAVGLVARRRRQQG